MPDLCRTPWGTFLVNDRDYFLCKIAKGEFLDAHLKPVFDLLVDESTVVLDVGAHSAFHSIYLSKIAKEIYAYEPNLNLFRLASANLFLNQCKNVALFDTALNNKPATMEYVLTDQQIANWTTDSKFDYNKCWNTSVLRLVPSKYGTICGDPLDELSFPRIGLLKIDANGCDYNILLGAISTLKKDKPYVLFKPKTFGPFYNKHIEDYISLFNEIDYEVFDLTNDKLSCLAAPRSKQNNISEVLDRVVDLETDPGTVNTTWGEFVASRDSIGDALLRGEFWDSFLKKVYDDYLNKTSVVIDAGAHVGFHTVYLSSICKKVYSFEPQPYVFKILQKNLFLNRCYNVTAINRPLYSENKKFIIDLIDYTSSYDSARLGLTPLSSGDVESTTIDSLNLPELDLIKIDAQGSDLNILKGAQQSILRCRPILLFEIEDETYLARHGVTEQDHFNFCEQLGYTVKKLTSADYIGIPKEEIL